MTILGSLRQGGILSFDMTGHSCPKPRGLQDQRCSARDTQPSSASEFGRGGKPTNQPPAAPHHCPTESPRDLVPIYWTVTWGGAGDTLSTRGSTCRPEERKGGGGWHKASGFGCSPLAARIGLSPPLILTLCGPERVLVVSTEPPDDLSCLTTPGVGRPRDGLLPVPLTRCILMHTPSPCRGLPTPALTCARWGVHLRDHVPDRGF